MAFLISFLNATLFGWAAAWHKVYLMFFVNFWSNMRASIHNRFPIRDQNIANSADKQTYPWITLCWGNRPALLSCSWGENERNKKQTNKQIHQPTKTKPAYSCTILEMQNAQKRLLCISARGMTWSHDGYQLCQEWFRSDKGFSVSIPLKIGHFT